MSGMNRHTGRALSGDAHLGQSIVDILTTPRGSMVTLRDYGSDLPDLLDQPINGETMVDVYMATAEALDEWEPRIEVARVQLADAAPGRVLLDLTDANGNLLPIELSAGATS